VASGDSTSAQRNAPYPFWRSPRSYLYVPSGTIVPKPETMQLSPAPLMRAAVYHGRGDVRIEDRPKPAEPSPGSVTLKVVAASICGTDVHEYTHGPNLIPLKERHPITGHRGPLILGHEMVGHVVARGRDVTNIDIGDLVAPGSGVYCMTCPSCLSGRPNLCDTYYTIGLHCDGGLAEFVNVPARICRRVDAATVPQHAVLAQPIAVAMHAVDRSGAVPGNTVAVMGVGGIGAFVVAVCEDRGIETLAIDISEGRLSTAAALGASRTLAAATLLLSSSGGSRQNGVDVVVEASGTDAGFRASLALVKPGGRLLLVGLQSAAEINVQRLVLNEVDIATSKVHICDRDLPRAIDLLGRNRSIAEAAVDDTIGLEDLVERGLRRMAGDGACGKIVVTP
jgi:(R,R)-butanediol dehydrogenase/meso-butanediol dehydrogenase/diacetyl reductase